jgi:hypothetical protein
MCDDSATSKEHVPPRCLFPEAKDLNEDHRKDLIRVPSCRAHNSKKSAEDEFLMISLAGIIGSNSIGYRHRFTKVDRALKRAAYRQIDEVFTRKERFEIRLEDNKFVDVILGTPDHARLETCFDHICRGLYYHENGYKFDGRTKSLLGFTKIGSENPREFQRLVREQVEVELAETTWLGSNPDVFCYRFTNPDKHGVFLVQMRFYGGLDIYSSFIPDGTDLNQNLAMLLMNNGVHTVIRQGRKEYVFNRGKDVSARKEST